MNYYISDLHFFCNSQLDNGAENYDRRPYATLEEMHADILARWNKKVTNGDSVYILGDISRKGRNDELIALVAQLKGRKVLIKGNHDDLSDYRLKQLFAEICDYKEMYDSILGRSYRVVLCHYPILMWNGQHKGAILLYGHTHVTAEDRYFQECLKKMNENKELHHERDAVFTAYNVGCMMPYMNYEPRSLKEIMEAKNTLDS
jgi:calcineurin-like phosphoesterase family protein